MKASRTWGFSTSDEAHEAWKNFQRRFTVDKGPQINVSFYNIWAGQSVLVCLFDDDEKWMKEIDLIAKIFEYEETEVNEDIIDYLWSRRLLNLVTHQGPHDAEDVNEVINVRRIE